MKLTDVTKIPRRTTNLLAHSSQTGHAYSDGGKPEILPTPRSEGDILSSPHLKPFTFNDLKSATKKFCPDSLIGQGGFGYVYKGRIEEMVVAVKKLKPEGFQGHKEWLVGCCYVCIISFY